MKPNYLPYGKQNITEKEIQAVTEVLSSEWLTTGPKVEAFEGAVADYVGTDHAVAVNSGTSALHTALFAVGVQQGDEVIVPPITFAATANAVAYLKATPVFTDVCPDTLLLDPQSVQKKITPATKAILAVDYAGQACDYSLLIDIARQHNLILIADSCHSLGGKWRHTPCGAQADLSVFSFHPVKPITTGEGGMVVTNNQSLDTRMRTFRNHGITTDHRHRQQQGDWFYEMQFLGFNYRLSDLHCALGLAQLSRLDDFIVQRRRIAAIYDTAFKGNPSIRPLLTRPENYHGYHLYVVRVPARDQLFKQLRSKGIGCNIHYIPVHLHPWYRTTFQTAEGLCPNAEAAYQQIISLPIYPDLALQDQERVIEQLLESVSP